MRLACLPIAAVAIILTADSEAAVTKEEPAHDAASPLNWWKLREQFQYDSPAALLAASELFRREISGGAAKPLDPAVLHALRVHMTDLGEQGLSLELVREMDSLPDRVRHALVFERPVRRVVVDGETIASKETARATFAEFRFSWIVALLDMHRAHEAGEWLAVYKWPRATRRTAANQERGHKRRVFPGEGVDESEFLHRVVSGPGPEDPFDVFVGNGETGLLWGPGSSSPLSARAASRFMKRAGYPAIAKHFAELSCSRILQHRQDDGVVSRLTTYPAAFPSAYTRYRQLIDAYRVSYAGCREVRDRLMPSTQLGLARRKHREMPLPVALQSPASEAASRDAVDTAETLLPRQAQVVREERQGDRIAVISLSHDVDPVGEFGAGGYWLDLSSDGGRSWQDPLYLGLQQFQPYVVVATSKMPLLRDRFLQIEVEVQELDEASMTIPPVALRLKREAKDLYIELSLDDLTRDSDGDALPDLLEDRLRTSAVNPDTDGDGISDRYDGMPQAAANAPPHEWAPIVIDVLRRMTGYEVYAIRKSGMDEGPLDGRLSDEWRGLPPRYTFLKADPALLSGLSAPENIAILTDADVEYLTGKYGICRPLELPALWLNRARTKAVVKWSVQWAGGTLYYRWADGEWFSEVVARGIT